VNDTKVKQQIVDKLNEASTVLVALNSNPTVDELSSALGVTLSLNKKGKHATAIFSGAIPPAIEFLEPEKTFEQNVDSLRDFIIALDKEKADHLRYKVVDDMVKIFITPYRTTITDQDLEFSQGDYNVDFVLAIGVKSKEDLDRALEAHGAILDEATVASISIEQDSSLGSINWNDKNASSYSEMLASLTEALKGDTDLLDEQIATAYLTGIVAATERFSNSKTSSRVMTTAATLMGAGANQQLIATQLEKGEAIPTQSAPASPDAAEISVRDAASSTDEVAPDAAGALAISHEKEGSVDSVATQTAEENQNEAAKAAEELARQTAAMQAPQPDTLAEQTQAELAQHLADTTQLPTVSPAGMGFEETPLRGAVSMDQWKAPEPSLGGTLNATTEEAAAEKQREALDDRNRTILSHDSGHYLADQPSFQAPMSAAVDPSQSDDGALPDVFGPNPTPSGLPAVDSGLDPSPTATGSGIPVLQPQASSGPTLAQIDEQNRGHDPLGGLPPLPPVPPMPDFTTLPPLPTDLTQTPPSTNPIGGQPLGSILPPAPASDDTKSDPAQFQIPGQS
jgi:hypothetical protein